MLTDKQVSEALGVSVASLRRWRLLKQGPRYLKIGASVRYRPDDVTRWLDSRPTGGAPQQEVRNENEAKPRGGEMRTAQNELTQMESATRRSSEICRPGRWNTTRVKGLKEAEELARACEGRLCYVQQTKKWLLWDGDSWRRQAFMSEVLRDPTTCFLEPPRGVLRKVRNDKRVLVSICRLDAKPDLLGTRKGVVDLRTGAVLTPSPEMFITRSTAVAPVRGTCTRWCKFLHEQTGGDVDLQGYIQRMAGYCLTGHTSERATFLLLGPDGGGKDVFLKITQAAFGTYAEAVEKGSIGLKRLDWTLAGLVGSRLVRMPEFRSGNRWRGQAFMTLGSEAPVAARFRLQRHVIYKPSFKLLFSGTFRPSLAQDDRNDQQRAHIIPFTQLRGENTPTLADELIRAELPEILAWMINGAVAWYRGGLRPPQRVLAGTGDSCCGGEKEREVA